MSDCAHVDNLHCTRITHKHSPICMAAHGERGRKYVASPHLLYPYSYITPDH